MFKNSLLYLAFAALCCFAIPPGVRPLAAGEAGGSAVDSADPVRPDALLGEWTHGTFTGEVRTVSIESWFPGASYTGGYYFGSNGLLIYVHGGRNKDTLDVARMTARYRVEGDRILLTGVAESRHSLVGGESYADRSLPDAVMYFRITEADDGATLLAIAERREDLEQAVLYRKRKGKSEVRGDDKAAKDAVRSREAEAIVGAWRYGDGMPNHVYGGPLDAHGKGRHYAAVHTFGPDGTYEHVFSGSGPTLTGSGLETAQYRIEGNRIHFTESFTEFYDPNMIDKSFKNNGRADRTEFFEQRVNDRGESQIAIEQREEWLRGPHPWFTKITGDRAAAEADRAAPAVYVQPGELIGSWRKGVVNPERLYDESLDDGKGYYGTIHIFRPDGTWTYVNTSANPVLKIGTRQKARYRVEENRLLFTECREEQVNAKVPSRSYANKPMPDMVLFFTVRTDGDGKKQILLSNSEIGLERTSAWFTKDAGDDASGR